MTSWPTFGPPWRSVARVRLAWLALKSQAWIVTLLLIVMPVVSVNVRPFPNRITSGAAKVPLPRGQLPNVWAWSLTDAIAFARLQPELPVVLTSIVAANALPLESAIPQLSPTLNKHFELATLFRYFIDLSRTATPTPPLAPAKAGRKLPQSQF